MVKFLHTADWHLGIKYKKLGDKAQKAREIRLKTVEKLLNKSKEYNVDFILIAGDLFDSNQVNRSLVTSVSTMISKVAPTPVYILPGNHDPLGKNSLFNDQIWDSLDNLTIFHEEKPLDLGNVTIYPCPVSQKKSKDDPTQWIDANENNHISIGAAHGNLQAGFIEDANFPIDPLRTEKSGLDYLALGEWHSLFKQEDSNGITRTVYPGTPETTKFGENNSGQAVIVEIDAPNTTPNITPIDVGTLSWQEHVKEINSLSDAQILESELESIQEPENSVISLEVKGVTDQETINFLSQLDNSFGNHFMFFQLFMDELYLKPNLLELKALLPEGAVVNQTFEALMALMKTQPEIQEYSNISPERTREIFSQLQKKDMLEGLSPEVLNRAFLLMYQMIKEVS
ncbi:MAG: metallophosphoesterase family protein [Methanomicrobiales archaeon]